MNTKEMARKVWSDPIYFLAFGFGSGLMRKAPGTWGTVAAIPVFLLLQNTPVWLYLITTILFFVLGIYVCEVVSKELGVHDYKGIAVVVTYHPAYLLRNPAAKKETWKDIKLLLDAMELPIPQQS